MTMFAQLALFAMLLNGASALRMNIRKEATIMQRENHCSFDGSSPLPAELHSNFNMAKLDIQKLEIRKDFLEELRQLPPIPRKTHVKWPDKDVVNSKSDMVQYGIRKMIDLNPEWEHKVWNDTEVDAFLEKHLSGVDWELLKDKGFAEKSDLWRLVLMYCEGGYYQDVDRIYNIPFSRILEPDTRMLLPQNGVDFSQDIMGTAPGNPIFKTAIRLNLARRRAAGGARGSSLVLQLGPATYFNAVTKELFGVMLERGDTALLDRSFDVLDQASPLIKAKKESWCHLIVAEQSNCEWISREGLYREAKVAEWKQEEEQSEIQHYKNHPKILFGMQTSFVEKYEKLFQAQRETWASGIHFLIAGGRHDNINSLSVCADVDQTCKEAALLYHASQEAKKRNSEWFVSVHDDAYVNLPVLLRELTTKQSPSEPLVFSDFGCGQALAYHSDITHGPPPGWVDPVFSCKSVWKKGGMCSGAGYVVSRQALDDLTREHHDMSQFIKWYKSLWTGDGKQVACDLAMSCVLNERSIPVKPFPNGMNQWQVTPAAYDGQIQDTEECKAKHETGMFHVLAPGGNGTKIAQFMHRFDKQCQVE